MSLLWVLSPSPYVEFWLEGEEEGYVKGAIKTKNELARIKLLEHC